jgi:hypothetical protein
VNTAIFAPFAPPQALPCIQPLHTTYPHPIYTPPVSTPYIQPGPFTIYTLYTPLYKTPARIHSPYTPPYTTPYTPHIQPSPGPQAPRPTQPQAQASPRPLPRLFLGPDSRFFDSLSICPDPLPSDYRGSMQNKKQSITWAGRIIGTIEIVKGGYWAAYPTRGQSRFHLNPQAAIRYLVNLYQGRNS